MSAFARNKTVRLDSTVPECNTHRHVGARASSLAPVGISADMADDILSTRPFSVTLVDLPRHHDLTLGLHPP